MLIKQYDVTVNELLSNEIFLHKYTLVKSDDRDQTEACCSKDIM